MLLKDIYNKVFIENLADSIAKFDDKFSSDTLLKIERCESWKDLSLKQRMRAITHGLDKALSKKLPQRSYQEKVIILQKSVAIIPEHKNSGLSLIIFPDFIEVFGCKEIFDNSEEKFKKEIFEISMNALAFFTEFGSSEFAVRQFIKYDQKSALEFFENWAVSDNYHIRRLASEGIRSRLPWGEALTSFKKDPVPTLPILEKVKNDDSEYVRRSVANNLNDISKDNPQVILSLLKTWQKKDKPKICPKLIKHSLRTLLKKGDRDALELIGIKTDPKINQNFLIKIFDLKKRKIKISENIEFGFALENKAAAQDIRLEYAIYFLLKNGTQSRKVFQITTKNFPQGLFEFNKKHSFKIITTRKYYCGEHAISLIVNGIEVKKLQFDLI